MSSIVAGDDTNNSPVAKVMVTTSAGGQAEAPAVVLVGADGAVGAVNPDGVADAATTVAWNGSAVSTAGYSSAYLEVTTYNTAITVKTGSAAANAVDVINTNGSASSSTITATGLYLIPYLAGNLTLTGLGTGVVNLILKR